MPKLDGLRAIAALLVMCTHYITETIGPYFDFGGKGVDIFFVISGYLITGILLSHKERTDLTRGKIYGQFIVRRTLRLFPVYYCFLLIVVLAAKLGNVWLGPDKFLPYYFTYTQNFLFLKHGFQGAILNHTWSLAVEEQFYLIWPVLILLIPKRAELWTICAVIVLGYVSCILFRYFLHFDGTALGVTSNHFITLGAGALLAWLMKNKRQDILAFIAKYCGRGVLIFGGAAILGTYLKLNDGVVMPTLLVLMSVSLIACCTLTTSSKLERVLGLPFLVTLGKISYGLYLFHKPILFACNQAAERLALSGITADVAVGVAFFGATFGVAMLSWKLFESPILKLKERFDS